MSFSITIYFSDEEFQKIMEKYGKNISKFKEEAKNKVKAMLEGKP
jgi:BMFP domain-containing protein YqiC